MSVTAARPTLVEKLWLEYRRAVLAPECPKGIETDCRLAFFAGVTALFYLLLGGVSEGEEIRERDLDLMSAIHDEIELHAREVGSWAEQERARAGGGGGGEAAH